MCYFRLAFASYPFDLIRPDDVHVCILLGCSIDWLQTKSIGKMMSVFRSFSLSLSNSPGTIYLHDGRRCRDVVCREGVLVKVSAVLYSQPDRLVLGL